MNRILRLAVVFGVAVAALGCRARQLCEDQDRFRCCLLELYTNQIMDNLIRVHNGLPIIQLDYSNITGTINQETSASISGSRESAAGAVTRIFGHMAGGTQTNNLTVTANPVLNDHDLYGAYLEFVYKKPGRLVVTPEPPPPGAAHIVRSCNKLYYWVPTQYKVDFLDLSFRTTSLRGEPVRTPETFDTTILGIDGKPVELDKQHWRLALVLKDQLPNDSGAILDAVIDGKVYPKLRLEAFHGKIDGKKVAIGEDTNRLSLVYVQGDDPGEIPLPPAKLGEKLEGRSVRIKLSAHRPPTPTPAAILESIRHELGQIRIQGIK